MQFIVMQINLIKSNIQQYSNNRRIQNIIVIQIIITNTESNSSTSMQTPNLSLFLKDSIITPLLLWKKNHTIKLNLIKQLFTTESQYVTFLSFVHVQIREVFDTIGFSPTLYSQIFEAIPEFYQLHKQILKSFQIIEEQKGKPGFILSAYIDKYIPYFRVYHKYFGTLDKRKRIVNKLKTDNKLAIYQKELQKITKRKDVIQKYSNKFLEYIVRIQFVDYLNKPFQRYHQYGLILSTYEKILPQFNMEKQIIPMIVESLKVSIQQLNQTFTKTVQSILTELDKKYGNVLKSNHTFYEDSLVGYYSEGKIMEGKLFVFNGMLLLTQNKGNEKQVKRILLDENSWFHNLKAGNNNTNTIFVKGVDTHQIFVLLEKNKVEFVSLMQRIFDQIYFRNSWGKEIMGEQSKEDSFVFKPLSVFLSNNRYMFVVFIKVASAKKGIRNFYSLNELRIIVQYLNETKIGTVNKSHKLHQNDQDIDDEEAEQIALGLFEYIIPMLRDIRVCQGYHQLQLILKIVEYMNWISYGDDQLEDDYLTEWLLGSEQRLRILSHPTTKNFVTVNIWLDSCHKKPVKISKTQRVYQIVQKIIGSGHSFEFTLAVGNDFFGSRVLDDDEILYECLKDFGQKFEEESNFFEKGFNVIFGKQEQTNIFLRKYLYLEFHNPAMYIDSTEYKLSLLARDYLDRSIPFLLLLQKSKQIQLISLLLRAVKFRDIINDLIVRIYKQSPEFQIIKALICQQLSDINDIPEMECFKSALRKTQNLGVNKFIANCRLDEKDCKLCIGFSYLEVKESITARESVIKIQFDELIFSFSPSALHISTPSDEYNILVNGVYGVQLVLERYMFIYNLWSKK